MAGLPRLARRAPLRAADGGHCVAHVLPLGHGPQRRRGCRGGAVAAVLVHEVALPPCPTPEAIAELYGLTPGEARVLFAVVEVGGVRETAEALGIGEATVKTHLHRLYGKTGAARQADLVKLVAGFASPVAGCTAGRAHCGMNDMSAGASLQHGLVRSRP